MNLDLNKYMLLSDIDFLKLHFVCNMHKLKAVIVCILCDDHASGYHRSKVYSFTHRLAVPWQTGCCCPKSDAVLGAVGRALILSSWVNSRFDAHLRCLRSVFFMMFLLPAVLFFSYPWPLQTLLTVKQLLESLLFHCLSLSKDIKSVAKLFSV